VRLAKAFDAALVPTANCKDSRIGMSSRVCLRNNRKEGHFHNVAGKAVRREP